MILALEIVPGTARAEVAWGGHAAYGLGGGVGKAAGVRQNLDLALVIGQFNVTGNSGHMPSTSRGWIVGTSGILGFGTYPSFGALEIGRARDNAFVAIAATVGPAFRLDPTFGAGLQGRVHADFVLVNVGARVIATIGPVPDLQLCFTIGLGRF
jgi:hypothetical protein